MKKLLLMLGIISSFGAMAQDTTNYRILVSGTYPASLYFTKNDTGIAQFADVLPNGMNPNQSTSQAIYMHPETYKLYALLDTGSLAERAIYEINPLTGENTMVYNLGDLFASVEITDSGRVFGIHGNGGSTPGAVYEIDIENQSTTMVFQSSVPAFEPRALGFNPSTQQLYVISGYIDTMYVYDMNTWAESFVTSVIHEEVHGAYYRNDTMAIVAYGAHIGLIDIASSYDAVGFEYDVFPHAMDLTGFKLIDAPASVTICKGEYLSALYESNSYAWFLDGNLIANSNVQEIEITESGVYHLVTQISDTSAYVKSELIDVNMSNAPVVALSPMDTSICEGDTITIEGTFGGNSQWYLNGNAITGATGNSYMATMAGVYNMLKTNQNGCSDSAEVGATVNFLPVDSCQSLGVQAIDLAQVNLFPNPTSGIIDVVSQTGIKTVNVIDMTGKTLIHIIGNDMPKVQIDLISLESGLYLISIESKNTIVNERVLKL